MDDGAGQLRALAPAALFDLRGHVAIVTGATGGIGRWLALGLGSGGASVMLTDHDEEAVAEFTDSLTANGIDAHGLTIDLTDEDAPTRVVEETLHRFGRVTILVNNAGVNVRVPMLEADRATFERVHDMDLRVPYFLSQATARAMLQGGSGSIIHVSSINNAVGLQGVSLLGPTKAALSQLAKVMTVEWAHLGIRTNCVAPGFMDTPMNATLWADPVRSRWILDRVPMARAGEPRELVGVVLLLAGGAGSFISGQTIYVDGGFLAGSRWLPD